MKPLIYIAILLSSTCSSCATSPRWNTDDPEGIRYLDTVADGLKCKWSGRVVDETGAPMTNFAVRIWFERRGGDAQTVHGRTDENGVFTAEGHPVKRVAFTSEEPGWYVSRAEHKFYNFLDYSNIDGDRWLPWNPTNTIIARKKRNPVKMLNPYYSFRHEWEPKDIPLNEALGFDCELCSYLPPYGAGEVADFTVEILHSVNGTNTLRFAAVDDGGGFVVKPVFLDGGCRYVTEYEAPEDGYSPQFVLTEPSIPTLVMFGKNRRFHEWCADENPQYVIFRSRVRKDLSGTITNATHGIFFADRFRYVNWQDERDFSSIKWLGDEGGQRTNGWLDLEYRFNPDPTSRSIEWDAYEWRSGGSLR